LDGFEGNPEVKSLYDFLARFDEKMITLGLKESKNWFKSSKPISVEVLRHNYKSSLKIAKDEKFAPLMSVKIPVIQDKPLVFVFQGQEHVPIETIKYNAKVAVIVEPRSIWFIGGNWGVTWNAIQIKIEDPGASSLRDSGLPDYAFID